MISWLLRDGVPTRSVHARDASRGVCTMCSVVRGWLYHACSRYCIVRTDRLSSTDWCDRKREGGESVPYIRTMFAALTFLLVRRCSPSLPTFTTKVSVRSSIM